MVTENSTIGSCLTRTPRDEIGVEETREKQINSKEREEITEGPISESIYV